MKLHSKKTISIILLLIWMGFIFLMSTDFGASEGKTNIAIISTVKTQTGIDMNKQLGSLSINVYFRKYMHIIEFAVLGLMFINVLNQYNVRNKYTKSVIFSLAYAASDEIHQMYVKNRTPLVADALIDTFGASLALLLVYMITMKRKDKSANNYSKLKR